MHSGYSIGASGYIADHGEPFRLTESVCIVSAVTDEGTAPQENSNISSEGSDSLHGSTRVGSWEAARSMAAVVSWVELH